MPIKADDETMPSADSRVADATATTPKIIPATMPAATRNRQTQITIIAAKKIAGEKSYAGPPSGASVAPRATVVNTITNEMATFTLEA